MPIAPLIGTTVANEEAHRLAKEASSEAAEMKIETEIVTMADIQQAASKQTWVNLIR